jgi:lysozyme
MGFRSKATAAVAVATLSVAATMIPSKSGLDSIRGYEGTRTVAYLDSVQVPTICTGSTRGVFLGQTATLAECEQRLKEDATYAGRGVGKAVQVKLTQGQYDALVSFVFNVGETQFYRSTLLRKLNAEDCYGAGREFDRWVFAGGKRLAGLVKRRAAERKQFEGGCVSWVS